MKLNVNGADVEVDDRFSGSPLLWVLRDRYPNMRLEIKRVIAEGDLVATHSYVNFEPDNPKNPGGAFMDFFRLKDGKIVEHWDVIQQVPEKSANNNGMF